MQLMTLRSFFAASVATAMHVVPNMMLTKKSSQLIALMADVYVAVAVATPVAVTVAVDVATATAAVVVVDDDDDDVFRSSSTYTRHSSGSIMEGNRSQDSELRWRIWVHPRNLTS